MKKITKIQSQLMSKDKSFSLSVIHRINLIFLVLAKNFNNFKKYFLNQLKYILLLSLFPFAANSAIVDVSAINIKPVSEFNSADIANFTGNGTILIDTAKTLDSITATSNSLGIINFTTANILTVSNDIGSTSASISNIVFNADGTLNIGGDLYSASAISTATDSQGNLTLSGSVAQTISAVIGSSSLKLNSININQDSGVVFENNINASTLSTAANAGNLAIEINADADFDESEFNVSSTLSTTSTNANSLSVNLGDVSLASAKTLSLNLDASFSSLSSTDSSSIVSIASDKTITLTGNITGSGIMQGSVSGVGNLVLNGSSAQSISSTYQLGTATNSLNSITISNVNGVSFNNDVFVESLIFNQSASSTASVSIASTKTLSVSGNITNSNSGSSTISGSGTLFLNGTSTQNINANLGSSTSNRLAEVEINNNSGVVFNGNVFLTDLTISSASTITANATLNTTNSIIDENLTISGSGNLNLGDVSLASAKTLSLNLDASFSSLSSTDSSSIVSIASDKTITLTGNITGSGIMQGSVSGVGNLVLNGSSAQSISSTYQLGTATNSLNSITISNVNGVSFNNDVFVESLIFNQSASSTASVSIASTKTLSVSGNITNSNSGSSTISGSGTLFLNGTSTQNINANLGSSTSNRLAEVEINNNSGVVFNGDNFLTTLTLTSDNLTIAGDTTTDVSDAVDLSGKNITFKVGVSSNPFAKIISASNIAIDNSTIFNIDYSTIQTALNYDDSTTYIIAESSAIVGSISDVEVADNSYLFNSSLAISGNNIVSTLSTDSSTFSSDNLGSKDFELISNALENTDLTSGLISISNQSQLSQATATLKPMNNAAQLTSIISTNNNIIKIVNSHAREEKTKELKAHNSIWGKINTSSINQKERENTVGYQEKTFGLVFGSDNNITKNNLIGVAVGYNKSNIEGDTNYQNDISIDSYQLVLYNSNQAENNLGFYNDNAINFNLNKFSTEREIKVGTFQKNAKADYSANSLSARVSLGYNYKNHSDYLIDPNFSLEYFSIDANSYQEKGAGDVGLRVKNRAVKGYFSDIGVKVSKKIEYDKYYLTPKLNIGFQHAFGDYNQKSTIAFIGGGSEINNDSIATQKNIFNLGLSINVSQGGNDSLQLQFDSKIADSFTSNGLFAKYVFVF